MYRHIASLQNNLIKHLVRLRQNSDYRYNCKSLIIEGLKPVKELCMKIAPLSFIAIDEHLVPEHVDPEVVTIVSGEIMHKISGMINPEGVLAEFSMPQESSLAGIRRIIALDEVREPGNLGSLLRSALALGWGGAFLLGETCDLYNEKALRAARGATFKIPFMRGSWSDLEKLIKANELLPLVADLEGIPASEVDTEKSLLLILSNEAHGASEQAKKLCRRVTIQLAGDMESLNVAAAGAILMHLLK